MNTRRHPRTLNEAFGPYTSTQIEEPRPARMCRQDKAITAFSFAVLAGVIAAAVMGWI